jgi:RNA polymerase sigma factor (sigma-70 family)
MDTERTWRHNAALIDAARCGEESALLALLEAAQPDIRRYAVRNCRHADDVDDAVQETLRLLYRRVGTIRAFNSVSAWLMTVVRRECWRLARLGFGIRAIELSQVKNVKDQLKLAKRPEFELRIDLAQAIRSLPEHYREVVLLRDVEEMSIAEISTTLSLTRESTKARLHRARAMIREYLLD